MGNINFRSCRNFSEQCDFCDSKLNESNPYVFQIKGYGKYDGYVICQNCLINKFKKRNSS